MFLRYVYDMYRIWFRGDFRNSKISAFYIVDEKLPKMLHQVTPSFFTLLFTLLFTLWITFPKKLRHPASL